MRTVLGIESFLHQADIRSTERWGLILNQASLLPNGHYVFDALLEKLNVTAFFSPQHGLFGHTQDNMIEWSGGTFRGIPVYSLYSTTRKPLPEQLAQIDTFLFDVQDVGSRYYTFIWTLFLVMQAAAETQKRVVVCDRPNPIAPFALAGPPQNPDFLSFVGLQPLPIIHQMTVGEIAGYFQKNFFPELELQIFTMKNWNRSMFYEQTGLHWFMPSPNMPTVETATVYPGMCLLEATNISEGRGTTRPFEFFGAAYFHHEEIATFLNDLQLPGCYFRPIAFQPTFQKFAGSYCEGCFIEVTDKQIFQPLHVGLAIIHAAASLYPNQFAWKQPPYEYEYEKMPIDILTGSSVFREAIAAQKDWTSIAKWTAVDSTTTAQLKAFHLYEDIFST